MLSSPVFCTTASPVAVGRLIVTFIIAALSVVAETPLQGATSAGSGGKDTLIIERQEYTYRTLCVMYDSISVCCSFGEICLPDKDSTSIEPAMYTVEPVNVDPTRMMDLARSKPFPVEATTNLSMWRGLHLQQQPWMYHFTVFDTCTWVLRLFDARDGRLLATLDSVGFLPSQIFQWGEYPNVFGINRNTTSSYGSLTYDLAPFAAQGVEAAWLGISVSVSGSKDQGCTLRDHRSEERISTSMRRDQGQ